MEKGAIAGSHVPVDSPFLSYIQVELHALVTLKESLGALHVIIIYVRCRDSG